MCSWPYSTSEYLHTTRGELTMCSWPYCTSEYLHTNNKRGNWQCAVGHTVHQSTYIQTQEGKLTMCSWPYCTSEYLHTRGETDNMQLAILYSRVPTYNKRGSWQCAVGPTVHQSTYIQEGKLTMCSWLYCTSEYLHTTRGETDNVQLTLLILFNICIKVSCQISWD